jgi:hypothetical protein
MKKTMYGLALAAGVFASQVPAQEAPAATCSYRDEVIAESSPDASKAQKIEHTVTLLAVTPAEGTEVRADTLVEVDLEYHVADFVPGKFILFARFPTVTFSSRSVDDDVRTRYLKAPSGRAHLCLPLETLYRQGSGMRWPLTFQVSLNEEVGESRSHVRADSRVVHLNSVDVPEEALALQNKLPPKDVQLALMMVFSHVELQGAHHNVCPARFPNLAAGLVKKYRAWESRDGELIKQIQELTYESSRASIPDEASAARVFDSTRASYVEYLKSLEEPMLREACEDAMVRWGKQTSDLRSANAANLDLVLKYVAARQKKDGVK